MNETTPAYGLWLLVLLNSGVFILFALSFYKPKNSRDWRSFGLYSAFIVALFTEMYGFPLTLYLFSGWLSQHYPGINFFSHDAGHLLEMMFGWRANPHFGPFHIISSILIFAGFWLLASAWNVLYYAQRQNRVATSGPYAYVRHPQYMAFIIIMFGFLLQWPTLITVIMFPVLMVVYARLAAQEEKDTLEQFGESFREYCKNTPAFFPHLGKKVNGGTFS
ncbi:isoprenylcysteine carboxylmethyltransferase family protein [Ferrovum sp.]|uniref:methyltransferase family protein n=1 Tax=Ferrovum sp. TaxID=2609467 RepID=UPI002615B5C3|nr:isoprenylcysteine carboxylmethyltransferase family protein [Ferrovum sp.]